MISESKPTIVGISSKTTPGPISGQIRVLTASTASSPVRSQFNKPAKQSINTNKLIKVVKTGNNKNVENIFMDQEKIMKALQRLKASAAKSTKNSRLDDQNHKSSNNELKAMKKDACDEPTVNFDDVFISPLDKRNTEEYTEKRRVALPGWYNKLSHTMTGFLEVGFMVDAQLKGDDGGLVPAHQVILAHISPLLAALIPQVKRDAPDETVIILIPNIPTSYLRDFIHAVYTGQLSSNPQAVQNVFMIAKLLLVPVIDDHTESNHQLHAVLPKSTDMQERNDENKMLNNSFMDIQEFNPDNQTELGKMPTIENISRILERPDSVTVATPRPEKEQNLGPEYKVIKTSEINLLLLDSNTCEISEVSLEEPLRRGELKYVRDDLRTDESLAEVKEVDSCPSVESSINCVSPANDKIDSGLPESEQELDCIVAGSDLNVSSIMPLEDDAEAKSAINADSSLHEKQDGEEEGDKIRCDVSFKEEYKVTYQPADKPCPLCGKPRINHKNREIPEVEKGSHRGNYYKCCECSASRLTAKKLFSHLENHVDKKFKCTTCDKGYSYKNLLMEHEYKIHGDGRDQKFSCPYQDCEYKARYKQTLHTHVTDHHKTGGSKAAKESKKTVITCPKCSKSFKKQHFHAYHKKACQTFKDGKFACPDCDKRLNSKFALNKHILYKHTERSNNGEKTHYCDICTKYYSTQYSLYNHRLFKHGVNSKGEKVPRKLYPCSICNKLLTTGVKLKTHIQVVHMGKRDFSCRFCAKQFTSKSNLTIHEGTQHTGVLPYSCELCEKSYGRKTQLSLHRQQVHDKTEQQDSIIYNDSPDQNNITQQMIIGDHISGMMNSTVTNEHDNMPSQVIQDPAFDTGPVIIDGGSVISNATTVITDDTSRIIADQLENHVMEEIDHHVIREDSLNDGHYYVVNDLNSIEGVQVCDVVIPMEFVEVMEDKK